MALIKTTMFYPHDFEKICIEVILRGKGMATTTLDSSLDSTDESRGAPLGPSRSKHTLRVKNRQPVSHRSGRSKTPP